ncbi:MAG: flagellar protein, partial [Desulfotomaculaceae bacterium]|nr:flagellar protein [Desulfotomaculaceae bacterium]
IVLAGEDLAKIGRAVSRAEAKGSRNSLIIYGDLALVASIRNKTVVTALDGKSSQEHVFTNIDSAVIVK